MSAPTSTFGGLLVVLALLPLAGCGALYPRVEIDDAPPQAAVPAAVPAAAGNGSLFSTATYRPLFEDYRARLVGDTLQVQIVEKVSATQTSTSSLDKAGTLSGSVTALPGIAPNSFGRAGIGGTSDNSFAGKGSVANSNDFSGTITVTVRAVLPNGHLLIAGEKQIGVNNNIDVLRFSGQVDPRTIMSGNVVPSAQIANVRLEQRGRGAQADAQAVGWLSRVFLSVMPI
ncbi:MAG: flagellar basal body L-ring protein FlgH [Burkholderiales bacterium]|nr:flagellar basal body L-ring protein FlgH [Burkholderiales bacterium]